MLAQSVGAGTRVLAALEGLGQLAALGSDAQRAVRLFGAVAALRESAGAAIGALDRERFERRLADARAALSPAQADVAFGAGQRLSLSEAMRDGS